MAVESELHLLKVLAAHWKPFKRPPKGETRFQAAMRRLMERTWLRFTVESELAAKELSTTPEQLGSEQSFKKLKYLTVGNYQTLQKFDIISSNDPALRKRKERTTESPLTLQLPVRHTHVADVQQRIVFSDHTPVYVLLSILSTCGFPPPPSRFKKKEILEYLNCCLSNRSQ
jgi:hypothetical protein